MGYRAILLDLDDTLFDRTAALRSWAAAQRELSPDEWQLLLEIDGRGHRPREAFAADARERLGLAVDAARFGHALVEHIAPEPGVAEAVAELAASRRVAVVTNGGTPQRAKLQKLGLDSIVHAVFVSSEVGIAKPSLAIFETALKWTENAAADVLFVGDDPLIDLAPASSLGMATAWRARSTTWPGELAPPTHQIGAIREVAQL